MTAALCVGAADGASAASFGFRGMWGSPGIGPAQFNVPDGVAVNALGDVYIADRQNNRVQKFTSTGRFLAALGAPGSGPGQFSQPYGVAVDGWGDVFVADTKNNRIQKLSPDGRFLARWGRNGGDGSAGVGNGEFNDPRGVGVDDLGNVYVADHGNHRIQKLSPTGRFLARWGRNGGDGTPGAGPGEFNQPRGVAVDHAGHIYVAEKLNHRIQELGRDGRFIRRWGAAGGSGVAGTGNGEFNLPYNVAIDNAGDLYVTDVQNNRVQKFSPTGAFLAKYGHNGGDGSPGTAPGEFEEPYGLATDCHSAVYVTEEGTNRVQKLGLPDLSAPRCPPVVTVAISAAQRAVAHGGLSASVACDRPCTATVAGRIAGAGPHALSAGAVKRALLPRRPVRVRLSLGRAERQALARALRAGERPMASVTATARGFAGRARAVRRLVRVAR